MSMSKTTTMNGWNEIELDVGDASGQRWLHVSGVRPEWTVRELISWLLPRLRLLRRDHQGRDLVYRARLEREGRHLHGSERVADVLRREDRISLQPDIQAG